MLRHDDVVRLGVNSLRERPSNDETYGKKWKEDDTSRWQSLMLSSSRKLEIGDDAGWG